MTSKNFPSFQQMLQRTAESQPRYSNYAGDVNQAPGQMNVLNRTLTIKIVNASSVTGQYTVFGYDTYGDAVSGGIAACGSDTYVTVTVAESSHAQVKRDSAKGPFYIAGAKFRTTDVDQFSNLIYAASQSSTGKFQRLPVQLTNFDTPMNQNNLLLAADPSQFSLRVDGMSYLTGTIDAGVTFTIIATLAGRVDISEVFEGQSPVAVSNAPYPTGQMAVVLQQGGATGVSQAIPMISGRQS